jgi:hypothetical protein
MAMKYVRTALSLFPMILVGGLVWFLFFTLGESEAQTSGEAALAATSDNSLAQPAAAPAGQQPGAVGPATAEPLGHLRISRQHFRRGGLGSKALVTFTLRNDNDYAIKDLEILCSFRSRDGHYSTERRRTINDTVNAKSRKAFPPTLVGYVNIKASKAKCSLLTASRG